MTHSYSKWPIGAAAAALAVSAASLAYRLAGDAERYSQFTVGSIAWHAAAKLPDYLLLAALVVAAGAAWAVFGWLARYLASKFGPPDAEVFVSTLGYCALPAIAWTGANLFGAMLPLNLVHVASAAIAVATVACSVLLRARTITEDHPVRSLHVVLTAGLLGALFLPMLALGVNRVALLAGRNPIWWGTPGPLTLSAVGAGAALLVGLLITTHARAARVPHLVAFLQLPYPWAFLIVLPMPWTDGQRITGVFPAGWLPAGALLLVAIGYIDLLRRWLGSDLDSRSWTRTLSPVCLAAVIITFRLAVPPTAHVSPDDYHFGEWVLPWWSWTSEGQLPFRDHVPARGMVNYSNGAAAALLGDPTASFITAAGPLVMSVWFVGAMTATAAVVGALPAAAMFVLPPISDRITDIDSVMTMLLMVGWYAFFRTSATRWATGWILAVIAAFLFAPGQALLLAVATAPLLAWQLGRGALNEPRTLRRTLTWTIAVLAAMALLTPFGSVLLGAWRYVAEHSAVASVAHGIEWRLSVGTQGTANYWLAEAIRTSFIAVPIASLALLSSSVLDRNWQRTGRLAVFAVPVLLLGLLYIPRAASRIDPGSASRLGLTSVWMHSALMPVVLHAAWGSRRWPAILAISIFVLGALTSMTGGMIQLGMLEARAIPSTPRPATLIDGKRHGVPALGFADLDPAHGARITRIRRLIDAVLEPSETYLDLTNRNAHYFYFDRRPPIESGAIYNLPNEVQQVRAVRRLAAEQVPLVLASADSLLHDGGPPSLRAHAIYRYVVQRYAPVRVDGYIFMVAADRMDRARSSLGSVSPPSDAAALLDEAFAPPPLESIPIAWGRSWNHLQDAATLVKRVDVGASGELALDVPVAGRDAGILVLEMTCAPLAARVPELAVTWSGDNPEGMLRFHGGPRLVIPLDASPRWLLSRQITALQVRSSDNTGCSPGSIRRAELWQRRIAAITDPK